MIRRMVLLAATAALGVALLYLSRFWPVELWSRQGALAEAGLHPGGGLLRRWLRGTPAAPYELLIWACGAFLILTGAQRLVDRLWPPRRG